MRWNEAQRIVLVVAYALTLWFLWRFVESAGWFGLGSDGGSFSYLAGSGVAFTDEVPDTHTDRGARLATQLVLVALWAAPSVRVLRSTAVGEASSSTDD